MDHLKPEEEQQAEKGASRGKKADRRGRRGNRHHYQKVVEDQGKIHIGERDEGALTNSAIDNKQREAGRRRDTTQWKGGKLEKNWNQIRRNQTKVNQEI